MAADSLLHENAELRAALAAAMEENDGWRTLAGILQQRNAHAESQLTEARRELDALRYERTHGEPPF